MFRRTLRLAAVLAVVVMLLPWSAQTAAAAPPAREVWVTAEAVNLRKAPSLQGAIVSRAYEGDKLLIDQMVEGQDIDGVNTWYRTRAGNFISGSLVSEFPVHPRRVGVREGRWIDVDLSHLIARVMENDLVLYSALVAPGRPGWETPAGTFKILWRKTVTTMSSASFGVGPGHPDYYVQPNVPYPMYFTEAGHAIHGNYWSNPNVFGRARTSHGCVGMSVADSKAFYSYGQVGMAVVLHY
ncbi:MAG: L,D-transpeptidase family protein [Chloroflexota bacterium]